MRFEPICLDHAASLIDQRPWEVSRDACLLADAQIKAIRTYGGRSCFAGMDIYNLEAEAYGCSIIEPAGNGVPSPGNPIFDDPEELLDLSIDPATAGRFPLILDAARRIKRAVPEAEVRVPLSGPFTIACHLLGLEETICGLFSEPEPMAEALMHLADNQLILARAIIAEGFPLSLYDSSVTPPLLSPRMFSEQIVPPLDRILSGLRASSTADTQLIVGGDTLPILDDLLRLNPHYIICPFETDQRTFAERLEGRKSPVVRINMNPAVFLTNKRHLLPEEIERVVELARLCPDATVGSLIPFDADPGIVSAVADRIDKIP